MWFSGFFGQSGVLQVEWSSCKAIASHVDATKVKFWKKTPKAMCRNIKHGIMIWLWCLVAHWYYSKKVKLWKIGPYHMLAFSGNPLWSRDSMQWALIKTSELFFFQHFERSPGDASGLGKQQCICQNWQMYLSSSVMHGVWKKRRWCKFLTMGALDSHWTAAAKQPSKCKIKALKGFPE